MDFQNAIEKLKKFFNTKQGRLTVVGFTVFGVAFLLSELSSSPKPQTDEGTKSEYTGLIDEQTKEKFIEHLKSEQEKTKEQVSQLQRYILELKKRINEELQKPYKQTITQTVKPEDIEKLNQQIQILQKNLEFLSKKIWNLEQKLEIKRAPVTPENVLKQKPVWQQPSVEIKKVGGKKEKWISPYGNLTEGFYPAKEEKELEKYLKQTQSFNICLPRGDFGKVVFLTGLSAPTGPRAAMNPIPVLMAIPSKFIEPNLRRTYKLKDCFAIGWGAGDLSSERIKVKVTNISCKVGNKAIDIKVKGYIAGPDGKEGIKGILVEKRGQYLAKALMASFAEGMAAIARYASMTVSVNPLGSTSTVKPGEAFKVGIASGIEKAFQRLSDYYMRLADEVLPVIEVGSGISGTLVLLHPVCSDTEQVEVFSGKNLPWAEAIRQTKKNLEKQNSNMFQPFYRGWE
jgi:hypothetical protein